MAYRHQVVHFVDQHIQEGLRLPEFGGQDLVVSSKDLVVSSDLALAGREGIFNFAF